MHFQQVYPGSHRPFSALRVFGGDAERSLKVIVQLHQAREDHLNRIGRVRVQHHSRIERRDISSFTPAKNLPVADGL